MKARNAERSICLRRERRGLVAVVTLLAAVAVFSAACGKRTPPLPPKERVTQRAEINGFQRGNEVILSWQMPARNESPSSVLNISRIDVYRLAEPLTAPQSISEDDFASRAIIVAALKIEDGDFGLKQFTYRDSLQFAGQPVRLRYAVRYVNASGQKAAFSNFFLLEPASKVAKAPTVLQTELSQEDVRLTWEAPAANIDETTPPNIIGYNVYRSESREAAAKLLNQRPIADPDFRDTTFEFEKSYFYFVRTVSLGTGGESVESSASSIIEISPKDTFPPSAPRSITIAASPASISIFFPANPENDVVGYTIYRSEDSNAPLDRWTRVSPELLERTTFEDTRVESSKTYYYYITATDRFKNISQRSEVVSERVP
ncbi:MAG: fibronectin type III domain-containing protein [Acidobacteria bacterium]|nr:fibronectin type III domain-containing protein [Acidobacteriota bacterium]